LKGKFEFQIQMMISFRVRSN